MPGILEITAILKIQGKHDAKLMYKGFMISLDYYQSPLYAFTNFDPNFVLL